MGDEPKSHLPATLNLIRPPLWGRMMARTVSDIAEGELVLRFTNGAERTIKAAQDGAKAVLEIARARSFRRLARRSTARSTGCCGRPSSSP